MLVMTLVICGAVLCVAIAALFTFQVLNFRSNFQRDTATLAAVIANNSTAAMAFKDEPGGDRGGERPPGRTPRACRQLGLARRHVVRPLSEAGGNAARWRNFRPPDGYRFVGGHLLVTQPVRLKTAS